MGGRFQQLRLFPSSSHKPCFSGQRRLVLQLNSGFLLFLVIVLQASHDAHLALRTLTMLNVYINVLAITLPLRCLFTPMLCGGYATASPGFPMVTAVGQSFLKSSHSTSWHICVLPSGQLQFSKKPGGHRAGAPPLSLCICHFWELLEDGSSQQKAYITVCLNVHPSFPLKLLTWPLHKSHTWIAISIYFSTSKPVPGDC